MWKHTAQPIRSLPPGYREAERMRVTEPRRLFWLNVFSLIPLAGSGLVIGGLLAIYNAADAPLVIDALPQSIPSEIGLLLVLLVLPLHEWIHGQAIRYYGHRPRYGAKFLVLFATADGALFRRDEFIRIALAPLVAITLVGVPVLAFLPSGLAQWVALAVMMNAGGAIGDIWMTAVALRFAPSALIRDEEDSMRVFVAVPARP